MEDTINQLFYLTSDKNPLVEVYFSGNTNVRYPMLSFKKLEEYSINLVKCVEKSLLSFRKIKNFPREMIAKYESNLRPNTTSDPNINSLNYINEHLINRLIKNKYGAGLTDANIALKSIWVHLTKDGTSYKDIFSRLTYWDSTKGTSSLYDFSPRLLKDNWQQFPINKIGITKNSSLTGMNDTVLMAKYMTENKA